MPSKDSTRATTILAYNTTAAIDQQTQSCLLPCFAERPLEDSPNSSLILRMLTLRDTHALAPAARQVRKNCQLKKCILKEGSI